MDSVVPMNLYIIIIISTEHPKFLITTSIIHRNILCKTLNLFILKMIKTGNDNP